jgi:hypothetical protein
VAALQQSLNVALSLSFLKTILGYDLGHEVVFVVERIRILLGELIPLEPTSLRMIGLVSAAVSGSAAAGFEFV